MAIAPHILEYNRCILKVCDLNFIMNFFVALCRKGILSTQKIDDYAKDGGPGAVWAPLTFYLVSYEAHIHKLASNNFWEHAHLISKPYDLK